MNPQLNGATTSGGSVFFLPGCYDRGRWSMFSLPDNSKFSCVAIRGANVAAEDLMQDVDLHDGLWILGHSPVAIDEGWRKWLGTLQTDAFGESNLVIVATAPSACPFVLDGENQLLERRCLDVLIGLGLLGLWFDGPGLILNGCRTDDRTVEPVIIRQIHDSASYPRLEQSIPPTLEKTALAEAGDLAESIHRLLKRTGTRLLKGLVAAHKGLEGRYGDERLHQFVRSLEAVMKPEVGRTERQFVHRAQVFIGRSSQSEIIARQLYRLRSSVEHMNDYTTELVDVAHDTEAAQQLAQRRSLQAGLAATNVYRHILGTPELFTLFSDETTIQEFWTKPNDQQDQIWGCCRIDLEAMADEILDPFGVLGINKKPRRFT